LPIQHVPLNERVCTLYNSEEIGDEFHYLFVCENEENEASRKDHLRNYSLHHCTIIKFRQLMNSNSKIKLIHLAKFVTDILRKF
jgi:hypothetical protein